MPTDRNDFISAYCDRWCERCAFTTRCSVFAANAATATCAGVKDGLELAVGQPLAAEPDAQPPAPPLRLQDIDNTAPSEEEIERLRRKRDAIDTRIDNTSLMKLATAYTMLAWRWLEAEHDTWGPSVDPVMREAMEVISWDQTMIPVKLHRALNSREEPLADDHPVQNDANGSAKLALILIERSEASWRVIAQVTGGELPLMMADHLVQLRREVDGEFPDARRFVRPGFDEEHGHD